MPAFFGRDLGPRATVRRFAAPGFTLIEMLVSLAVLAVALSVVGVVFTITTRTASQAAALSEAQAQVRQFMFQLEEDLQNCNPSESVLVIVGRQQAAALNQDKLAAGRFYRVLTGDPAKVQNGYNPESNSAVDPEYSNPRADQLMFFTKRPCASQNPANSPGTGNDDDSRKQRSYASGAKFAPVQVAYGHAALGEYARQANGTYIWGQNLRHIENADHAKLSLLPSNRWHLARRATIIDALPPSLTGQQPKLIFTGDSNSGEFKSLLRCYSDDPKLAGDVAKLNWEDYLDRFSDPNRNNPYRRRVIPMGAYQFTKSDPNYQKMIFGVMYPNGTETNHHLATVLENTPADLRSNLGVQMLPACAWFQVEFLMPEDPRNSLDYHDSNTNPDHNKRADMPKWTEVEDGQTYMFVPDTQANRNFVVEDNIAFSKYAQVVQGGGQTVANTRVRMWPYAIRVTIRVFDPRNKLAEPIVRSLVHRFE